MIVWLPWYSHINIITQIFLNGLTCCWICMNAKLIKHITENNSRLPALFSSVMIGVIPKAASNFNKYSLRTLMCSQDGWEALQSIKNRNWHNSIIVQKIYNYQYMVTLITDRLMKSYLFVTFKRCIHCCAKRLN
jgi:hypothetical protein